uniref:Condensin complex subunit 2 n=1 Tax=Alexandrium catenella TaxID=2925 RepID=A0A7S1WEU6_ALECA
MPPHLDVDPQELFLRPDDKVVPGLDQGGDFPDLPDAGGDFGGAFGGAEDAPLMPGLDFDLADRPQTVGSVDIGYSRNSKFVDVKLVKQHLWDCISEDIEEARALPEPQKAASSFQGLVDRTVERLPKGETENLSVAVCFICALHLCNEKTLELEPHTSRPLGDFDVAGPP